MLDFRIPIRDWVSGAVSYLQTALGPLFDGFADAVDALIGALLGALQWAPELVVIVAFAGLTALLAGWRVGVFALVGLFLVENVGLWQPFLQTLSLVLAAQVLILLVGVPLGILAARSDAVEGFLKPVLDFMQTMPAFVYLIPAVMFFGIGVVPGVVATFVFAIPPLVRLVSLGIRQVPGDLVEAADAFGSTSWQRLVKVEMPVARPSIMAGVNQSIMLNLSMVVIAGMIGAGGVGAVVFGAITRLNVGRGFEGGLAIVILAVFLDRTTSAISERASRAAGTSTTN